MSNERQTIILPSRMPQGVTLDLVSVPGTLDPECYVVRLDGTAIGDVTELTPYVLQGEKPEWGWIGYIHYNDDFSDTTDTYNTAEEAVGEMVTRWREYSQADAESTKETTKEVEVGEGKGTTSGST
jgi:hypothetical protein